MNATTLHSSSTLNSNQSTMSCMGNPQAIIRKCVHPSMPHSNFYSLGNRAKIPKCNLQKKCCWFSQHFKSAEFLCKGWQILYVFKLSFTFFMSNLLPQNLGTFFEIYRSATGLIEPFLCKAGHMLLYHRHLWDVHGWAIFLNLCVQ